MEMEIWTVDTSNGEPKWRKEKAQSLNYYGPKLDRTPLSHMLLNELHHWYKTGRFIVLSKETEEELERIGKLLLFERKNPPAFDMLNLLFNDVLRTLVQRPHIPRVVFIDENYPRYWCSNGQVLRLAIEVPVEEGCILKSA